MYACFYDNKLARNEKDNQRQIEYRMCKKPKTGKKEERFSL